MQIGEIRGEETFCLNFRPRAISMHNIFIHEVRPRDGLQAEKSTVPLEEKICWIENLLTAG